MAIGSFWDWRERLWVDCAECTMGGNGEDKRGKCCTGGKKKQIKKGNCIYGKLIPGLEEPQKEKAPE